MLVHAGKYSLFGNIPQYSTLIFCVTEQITGGKEKAIKEVQLRVKHCKHTNYTLQTYAQTNVKSL